MEQTQFMMVLWLVGVLAEAMTGALAAGRKQMDLFGVVIIGLVTAIGGGTMRDILLGNYPLVWIDNWHYLLAIAGASLLTVLIAPLMQYLSKLFLAIDALGLAAFSIIGAQKTLLLGYGPVIAITMGIVTGVFGGILRDILCNEIPLIFRREFYALASALTATLFVLLTVNGFGGWPSLLGCLCLGFGLRMCAIRYRWAMPTFNYQSDSHH